MADENNLWLRSDVQLKDGDIQASRFLLQPSASKEPDDFAQTVVYLRDFFKNNFKHYEVHLVNPTFIRIGEPVSYVFTYICILAFHEINAITICCCHIHIIVPHDTSLECRPKPVIAIRA